MKADTRSRHRNAGRPPEKDARGFLQWLRGRPCIFEQIDPHGCEGKFEAAHLDFAGGKGVSSKVADRFAVPMCSGHHRTQHNMGWQSFMALMKVTAGDMLAAAENYWRAWPGRAAWERNQSTGRPGVANNPPGSGE